MKVVSFFSAKGGTCKTTMNMLFASFLQYHKGKRVILFDFDGPEYNLSNIRKRELEFASRKGNPLDETALYPIHEVDDSSVKGIAQIVSFIGELKHSFDYIVMDFGGSFVPTDAVCQLVRKKVIDLIVVPVELDQMIVASAKSLAKTLEEQGQETLLFFNKVHGKENPLLYEKLTEWFRSKGVNISGNKVKNTLKARRDSDNGANFIRSSVVFPYKEIRVSNPGIIDLFEEVAGYEGMEKTEETA